MNKEDQPLHPAIIGAAIIAGILFMMIFVHFVF